jgi:hypothetical protein
LRSESWLIFPYWPEKMDPLLNLVGWPHNRGEVSPCVNLMTRDLMVKVIHEKLEMTVAKVYKE